MNILTAHEMRRFWPKVQINGECWEWRGAKDRNGYGLWKPPTTSGMPMAMAHRYSYLHMVGEIPPGLELDHLCQNKSCVNPFHLDPVTRSENMRRASAHLTHCPQGHERSEANWVRKASGRFYCRACSRERMRARTRAQAVAA